MAREPRPTETRQTCLNALYELATGTPILPAIRPSLPHVCVMQERESRGFRAHLKSPPRPQQRHGEHLFRKCSTQATPIASEPFAVGIDIIETSSSASNSAPAAQHQENSVFHILVNGPSTASRHQEQRRASTVTCREHEKNRIALGRMGIGRACCLSSQIDVQRSACASSPSCTCRRTRVCFTCAVLPEVQGSEGARSAVPERPAAVVPARE